MIRDFQQSGILTSADLDESVKPFLSLETSNEVRSVVEQS